MEFQYYFDNSYVDSSSLTAFWPYPAASLSGNFTGNNPTIGSFPTTQVIQRDLSLNSEENFTLFATLKTYDLPAPPEYKFRTQVIFSSVDGGAGWDFGLLASNIFFISSTNGEIYSFNKINAGSKNCICLKKSGQAFTLYKYDILSQTIESEQTISFSNDANLDTDTIYVGYNSQSDIGAYSFSWYGSIDQLSLITESLGLEVILELFSGFEPKTFSILSSSSNYLLDSTWRPLSGTIPTGYLGLVQPYINNFTSFALGTNSGGYAGFFSGNVDNLTFSGAVDFAPVVDLCFASGTGPNFSYNSASGIAGLSGYIVEDNIKYNVFQAGLSGAKQDQTLISHTIKIYNPSFSYRINYDQLYQRNYTTTGYSETIDSGYYSGFYMSGVSQNDYYNNAILLGALTGGIPTGVGLLGTFDNVAGLFNVIEQSGYYFYNGIKATGDDITKDGTYVDLVSISEVNSDSLIYDLYSGLQLKMFGLQGYATGEFFPRLSVVYTGASSYTQLYRTLDYHETVPLHMFYGQPVLYKITGNSTDNLEDYWF